MKKVCISLFLAQLLITIYAQSPQSFKYQAVARDINGDPITDQSVSFRFSILQGNTSGTSVYSETQSLSTNDFGLATLNIGGGIPVSGNLSSINWALGPYFLKVEMDPSGGSAYQFMGASQLLSVPYALYSGNGVAPGSTGQTLRYNGYSWTPNSVLFNNGTDIGIGTSDPQQKLQIEGDTYLHDYFPFITLNDTAENGNAGLTFETNGNYNGWIYYSKPSENLVLNAQHGTGNRNDLVIHQDGRVGINTDAPLAYLEVDRDENDISYLGYTSQYPNYFNHVEQETAGDGQAAIYGIRTRQTANNGSGYTIYNSNAAITGNSVWGDDYSFGVSGFNYNDYIRCGGVIGSQILGSYWGALSYKSSGSSPYGGYFTSSASGTGKASSASTGIGIGAWGDLFGADIHGKVYGEYVEGKNYATFANGTSYHKGLDVHLQENGTSVNTALYTSVSTDASVQTSGYATLSGGKANIAFDPQFSASVSENAPIVVTVTPTGSSKGVYLKTVDKNGFSVEENENGKSDVTFSFIAIGKRKGFENPQLPEEVVAADYTNKLASGLHNDNDTLTNGEGLYFENRQLTVGVHPSTQHPAGKRYDPAKLPGHSHANEVMKNKIDAAGRTISN